MKRNRDNDIEISTAQTRIAHGFLQPFRNGMPQMQLTIVFELQDDKTNNAAATIRGDGGIEGKRPIHAVRAGELAMDRSWKWL